jgi:hypothetical protein
VPNIKHSEVLIELTDEMPLLLAPRDKFMIYIRYSIGNFLSISLHCGIHGNEVGALSSVGSFEYQAEQAGVVT